MGGRLWTAIHIADIGCIKYSDLHIAVLLANTAILRNKKSVYPERVTWYLNLTFYNFNNFKLHPFYKSWASTYKNYI